MIKLSRGFDIKLLGKAEHTFLPAKQPTFFALKPTDVIGTGPIPKLVVEAGSRVKAGEPLFYDKLMPRVQFCSPVSGVVTEIRRAAKRAIAEVVIEADADIQFHDFGKLDPSSVSREAAVERLLESGAWLLLRQRPFNVAANPDETPRDIFVSCFDTAPLAPDASVTMAGKEAAFQAGLNVLAKLTSGSVHLGLGPDAPAVFKNAKGVKSTSFSGPHPAGNVGVQIHHVAPIGKGEVVWTIKPQDVAIIGTLFTEGRFDTERTVAVTGSELKTTGYFKTRIGASVSSVISGNLKHDNVRIVSGNPLVGSIVGNDGFLGLYDDQITVLEEGNKPEFMGWLLPSYARPSLSRTFLSFLRPNKVYHVNTNNHGEERAYVMTGQYEQVVPMDLYPQYLIKSILYSDFEQMEGLGIYEVVEEDLALCEFVCTSKQPVQQILRSGLDLVRTEG